MDNKNFILAIALSLAVLIGWQYFFIEPQQQAQREQAAEQVADDQALQGDGTSLPQPGASGQGQNAPTGGGSASVPQGQTREAALAASERVAINTGRVEGSINLTGGRLDDLRLKDYHLTVDPTSPTIILFSPSGSPDPYYAEVGWVAGGDGGSNVQVPTADTVWTVEGEPTLTPSTPVTLSWTNDAGLTFNRTFAVDENYMFTVTQSVQNNTSEPVTLFPYGLISRHGTPETSGFFILHEGPIGVFGEEGLQEFSYDDLIEDGPISPEKVDNGWLGFTDKYWASTLIPTPGAEFQARLSATERGGREIYQSDYLESGITIDPGSSAESSNLLFAGAKEVDVISGYKTSLGIEKFDLLIDWGWFYFLTKPMFYALDFFYKLVGNFGVAILIVTVLVKTIFFPLANKAYVSMSKMKKLQPEMVKLRERYKDDKVKQQQAMMEIYKKEKINPVSGCVPILIQIPVFFALYKVILVTIEMRHAPFFGWIQDLSAPDPTTIFNLFGLIPWDPPSFLMIGIWPLIMGFTMWMQMKMNPTPPDATQAMIFNWMPVIFTFMLASFPAGLVIYWAWNNSLSVLQQYVIMRRQGVKVELWDNISGVFKRKKESNEGGSSS
ncbi:membrane protein insertase YidC [Amorphus orientalis]|uniref:Membrane protein insertase YidC n=1 Tax=Amorphus orientalis TaxID=649198 RepID=A0AAE3VR65_9HYPH|nr:membrane protein insertase YidC [Amorphus orientalis]MDQ0316658.1 YidC/Oxa1 family membrane protein insertase [Amorphus orientalis]